jgi:hypothetical protein
MEIYALDPARPSSFSQLTFGSTPGCAGLMIACGAVDAVPSPNGTQVLYRQSIGCESSLWVTRRGGGSPVRLGEPRTYCYPPVSPKAVWSADSTKIAFLGKDGLHIVRFDGTQHQIVSPRFFSSLTWAPTSKSLLAFADGRTFRVRGARVTEIPTSTVIARSPNGRWVASFDYGRTLRFDRTNGAKHWQTGIRGSIKHAWSPDSRSLAYVLSDGLWVFNVTTGKARRLSIEIAPDRYVSDDNAYGYAWSPDGQSIVYIAGRLGLWDVSSNALRVVSLTGRVRTLLAADSPFGGRMLSVASVRDPSRLPLRRPAEQPAERVGQETLLADGPINELATNGTKVAYVACMGATIWTTGPDPSAQLFDQRWPKPDHGCATSGNASLYSLALVGDRVATGLVVGCASGVDLRLAGFGSQPVTLAVSHDAPCGDTMNAVFDDLEADGDLLVYSSASEGSTCCPLQRFALQQTIHRAGPDGCPCPAIASSTGMLVPADVNEGRILAYGRNETWLLDRNGNRLLTLNVGPLGGQLWGDDLVLLEQEQLRVYSARTGALKRTVALPDVPSRGHECELRCRPAGRLVLEDVGHGKAFYLLDGQLHIVDLILGTDKVLVPATIARVTDDGLVYADGSRLFLLSKDFLP